MSNCRDKCKEESFLDQNYPEVGMYFCYFLILFVCLFVCLLLFFVLKSGSEHVLIRSRENKKKTIYPYISSIAG